MSITSHKAPRTLLQKAAPSDCSALVVQEPGMPYRLIAGSISPVVVTSPHSGRQYSRHFLDQSILSLDDLRKVEDAGIDRLLTSQPLPAPVLMAEFPRSFVDVNRSHDELDPAMFDGPITESRPAITRYTRSGLGMIPRKAANRQDIYSTVLPTAEVDYRRNGFYTPYHDQLKDLLTAAHSGGPALLLDCHSMPSGMIGADCDIVIGSNHGSSAELGIVNEAVSYFSQEGLTVQLNRPFSGGHITRHYGKPNRGISALQIEICRSCYLNEKKIELNENWHHIAAILTRFIMRMDEFMMSQR